MSTRIGPTRSSARGVSALMAWAFIFTVCIVALLVMTAAPAHATTHVARGAELGVGSFLMIGATTDVLNWVKALRGKPTTTADGANTSARASRLGELYTQPLFTTKHALAEEGSYFIAQNPTPGTGIALAAQIQAFADTNGLFVIKNNASVGSGIRLAMDYLKLIVTGATTAVQSVDFVFRTDTIDRFPTTAANATTLTPVNVNADDASASIAVVQSYANAGAMTIPAKSNSARTVGRAHAPTGLHFAGDEIVVQFGASERGSTMGLTAVRASGPSRTVADAPPIIIGPQQSLVVHRWSLTEAGAVTYEFELGWWERAG